jgi:hypothetical protein
MQQGRLGEIVGLFTLTVYSMVVTLQTLFSRTYHHLPSGPWSWPIVGNLLMLEKHPHIIFTCWMKRCEPLMHLQLVSINIMVTSSPTMAKEFFKTQDHMFQYC